LTKPARERQLERVVPVRLHGDNWVMMRVTLQDPSLCFVKPTDAAGHGRVDPTLGMCFGVE
jgi:hypothetical protein